MEKWQKLVRQSITKASSVRRYLKAGAADLEEIVDKYPARINPYLLKLIKKRQDPVWKQCVPDSRELKDKTGQADPLREERYSPLPGLVHRYPDRVLLYVSNVCASYCRFCTRKRKVGSNYVTISPADFQRALKYIRGHKAVRDVILSGGDPLMLDDATLEKYLKAITAVKHVEMVRIDSRVPSTFPMRITPKLCRMLGKYDPVYLLTHFNHPQEITKEAREACEMLAEAGVVLGNQSVLLKGINDSAAVLKTLNKELLKMRVRPYYIYMPDKVTGTHHFQVPLARARQIMRQMIGHISGLAIPKLIVDLPGGGGKVPVLPEYIAGKQGRKYTFVNFENRRFIYHDL